MSKTLHYRKGSVLYFQGDKAEEVLLLQSGKVNLVYQDMETGQDIHDLVQPGEFFGVKSALGRYHREENAVALQDTEVMVYLIPEFEQIAQTNIRIIMKMLKVFSTQLRRVHRQVSNLWKELEEEEEEQEDAEQGLFQVAEYYRKNKRYLLARDVYSRYLTYYPLGVYALQAAKNRELLEQHQISGENLPETADAPPKSEPPAPTATMKIFYDAMNLISQDKYRQAYLLFNKVIDAGEEPEYIVQSVFEMGHCLYLMRKYNDCVQYFTDMINRYPRHPSLEDALFYMGQCYEKQDQKEQALSFYKQILSMNHDQENESYHRAKRAIQNLED